MALGGCLTGGVPVPYELLNEMVVAGKPSLSGCPVTELLVGLTWCPERDLNPHVLSNNGF